MPLTAPTLDLTADPIELTAALVDIPSVSGDEAALAGALEQALRTQAPHLEVVRCGDAVLARTHLGRERRVLLAGHIDTVPVAGNLPSRRDGDLLHGCGTSDMKAGDAVIAHLAATLTRPRYDLTVVLYDCEEVEAARNGLGRIERELPEWLRADLAILGEPTGGAVEAGCQGTLRAEIRTRGRRAHSARSWLGDNAVHGAGAVLARLTAYTPREVDIDGCGYREGLQAVRITGGVAGNVVPDECVVTVNFRFAPDRDADAAVAHVREVFDGFDLAITDLSPGALPGLSTSAAQEFLAATGTTARAKYGWTDVARFAGLGIPALNYGPGDPNLAHTREEHVDTSVISRCASVLTRFLT
ncbi:succinyl-diaminopimelate desuccinylase [Pseudonocardia asaccharolytica]|uniref:Succinyl-diaminopimelate desuccinylase n=1 Tax=Pseudonocardia asaccharolytica DSM 44247 = NBRC 16224 TaxID=1123024 RepID=A0A511D4Q5_9PSEU|nr:succinyl-diaminopimelate desuccinylase [Pseudonocardia asaccharolytica]GEL18574.1 succinyl-diaminopimelate desuccinylase [Pseudonocardia asaccharolytica DSM 44247 = NBRC 16224]